MKIKLMYFLLLIMIVGPGMEIFGTNSLNILDPRLSWRKYRGTIDEMTITAKPQGVYMEYNVYLTFSSKSTSWHADTDTLEVEFMFDLPENAIVNDSWLWVGDTIVKAMIIDKWTASDIYEGIVKRRRDPSVLFKNSSTQYELRVYPLVGNSFRKVKISYMVPVNWSPGMVTSEMPTFMAYTSSGMPPLNIIAYTNSEFYNPVVSGKPELVFGNTPIPGYDPGRSLIVPKNQISQIMSIQFPSPMKNGIYVNRSSEGDENYYQMAFLPSEALGFTSEENVVVLIDYEDGKSNISKEQLLESIRQNMLSILDDKDKFMLIISDFIIGPMRNEMFEASHGRIDSVFDSFGPDDLTDYSNLPSLLAEGIKYINNSGLQDACLLVVSNSDALGSMQTANKMISDINSYSGKKIPIHIADYANKNLRKYSVGNINYSGNSYLYKNLSRISGGNYYSILTIGNLNSLIAAAFSSLPGTLKAFDLYTSLSDGFCYARYYNGRSTLNAGYFTPIIETGKYEGNFPFEIKASCILNSKAWHKSITIPESVLANENYKNDIIWTGNYINSLATEYTQTNDIVTEIIRQSMAKRVLSVYTAFLALEPWMMPDQNYSDNNDDDDLNTDTKELNRNASLKLEIYPNPLVTQSNIKIMLPDDFEGDVLRITIYDISGRAIKTFDIESYGQKDIHLIWDGKDNTGSLLPNGIYMVTISTSSGMVSGKIIINR